MTDLADRASVEDAPRRAPGVELIGKFEGSGFKKPPNIVRLGDGQPIQLPDLLYVVAEEIDGRRTYDEIASAVTERAGRELRADDVKLVVEEKLRPLGIVTAPDGSAPAIQKIDPLLALKFRVSVVTPNAVRRVTGIFKPLFHAPIVLAVIGGVIATDIWLFGHHGVAGSVRQALYQPALILLVLAMVILSAGFHELGHAAACSYSGATPGAMGAGIYIAWPAFYTDVTDAYRLDRKGRLRTDLGGIYFNAIFILVTVGVYFATGFEFLLVVIVIEHIEIVHQLLPFIRLDGYYIVTDVTGVPDLFTRIKPILRSLVPGRKAEDSVTELKPWARALATGWVILVVPLILINLALMAMAYPHILGTAWDSAGQQIDKLGHAGPLEAIAAVVQVVILAIPVVGIALTFFLLAKRVGFGLWHRTDGKPVARVGLGVLAVAAAVFLVLTLIPDGNYKPIRRDDKGTVGDFVRGVERSVRSAPATETPAPAPAGADTTPGSTAPADTTPTTPATTDTTVVAPTSTTTPPTTTP